MLVAFRFSSVAAKSILERLGIDKTETQENSGDPQLRLQPLAQPLRAVALALPLEGNLRPNALLPVVVQPQQLLGTAYTSPYTGAARGRSNPIIARMLGGRGGP